VQVVLFTDFSQIANEQALAPKDLPTAMTEEPSPSIVGPTGAALPPKPATPPKPPRPATAHPAAGHPATHPAAAHHPAAP
jgi:hypothetical protein